MSRTHGIQMKLDYPQPGETIVSPEYAVRVTAPEGTVRVEISIDGGPYRLCRESVGHWWYDWAGYEPGEHEAVVLARTAGGKAVTVGPRVFRVRLPGAVEPRPRTSAPGGRGL